MNRRKFFGMTAGTLAAAGLPAILMPEKTIFLPPAAGWQPYKLSAGYMREVEQYLINTDSFEYRYDAIGRDIWGGEHQFHVDLRDAIPELARRVIEDRFREDGLTSIQPGYAGYFNLALPRNWPGRYI